MASTSDADVIELTAQVLTVVAVLLGIVSHAIIFNAHSNITALARSGKNTAMAVVILAKCCGLVFFVSSLLVLQLPQSTAISCNASTRTAIVALFTSHALHHLYHGLQTITSVRSEILTSAAQLILSAAVAIMSIYAICLTTSEVTYPNVGCVLLFDESTLPSQNILISLVATSLLQQTYTAAMLSFTALSNKTASHLVLKERLHSLPRTAALDIFVSYTRLASLLLFFCFPIIFLRRKPMALSSCLYVYTAIDVLLIAESLSSSRMSVEVNKSARRRSSFAALKNKSFLYDGRDNVSWWENEKIELYSISKGGPGEFNGEDLSTSRQSPLLSGVNSASSSSPRTVMMMMETGESFGNYSSDPYNVQSMEMTALAFQNHSRRLNLQHDVERSMPHSTDVRAAIELHKRQHAQLHIMTEQKANKCAVSRKTSRSTRPYALPLSRRDLQRRMSAETIRTQGSVYSTSAKWI